MTKIYAGRALIFLGMLGTLIGGLLGGYQYLTLEETVMTFDANKVLNLIKMAYLCEMIVGIAIGIGILGTGIAMIGIIADNRFMRRPGKLGIAVLSIGCLLVLLAKALEYLAYMGEMISPEAQVTMVGLAKMGFGLGLFLAFAVVFFSTSADQEKVYLDYAASTEPEEPVFVEVVTVGK